MAWSVWALYGETKPDVWCPIHVLGPVWSGGGDEELGPSQAGGTAASSTRPLAASRAQVPLQGSQATQFFSPILDKEIFLSS